MKRLKAFTILELIVAMAISSLLIGMCFIAYQIIIVQFSNYKTNNQRIQDMTLCNYLLTRDVSSANTISQPQQGIFEFESHNEVLTYAFETDYIVRTNEGGADTFYLKPLDLETKQLRLFNRTGLQDLVTDIQVSLSQEQETFNLHFHKEYSPHILINAEDYIGN